MRKTISTLVVLALVITSSLTWASSQKNGRGTEATEVAGGFVGVDSVYFGGDIITVEGKAPEYVEAVAIKDGLIVQVGSKAEAMDLASEETQTVNLRGKTLIPGFIDSHSHFILTGLKLATVNLDPPPAGSVQSIPDILSALGERLATGIYDDEHWLFGWGYDTAMLVEGRHPTRFDLDQVSTEVPVVILHFSTHMIVANSKALELLQIDESSVAPEGGVIRRMPDGRQPNGILEEQAIYPVFARLISIAQGDAIIPLLDQSQDAYKSKGFTTALEFGAQAHDVKALQAYADSGRLEIDLVAAVMSVSQSEKETAKLYSIDYKSHFRVGGGKINIDGGSPGRTAYLRKPYYTQEEGVSADYRGYSSIAKQEDLNAVVESFYEAKTPIFIHALGDAAIDQAIAAVSNAQARFPRDDIRTQLIHLQVFQPDQMETLAKLDVTLTFQNTHNFYFADFHNQYTLGPERTRKLTPLKTSLDKGFSVTFHHDSPVHPVDSLDLMWIAVNREGRSGTVYGPEERLTPYEALYASTMEGAYQLFEESRKGSLAAGKLADMVILSDNPLKVDPARIKDIKVLETIKEGKSIFLSSVGGDANNRSE